VKIFVDDSGKSNFNHAEKKLFGYIKNQFGGQHADIDIAVQNTSKNSPGMCDSCSYLAADFSGLVPEFNVRIFEGSTMEYFSGQ
jgi:hypothetical protein